jgi:hypothetical protein
MSEFWTRLRQACDRLDPGSALETPVSERLFEIEGTFDDRIEIRFQDSGEERSLRREQFEVVVDRLDEGPLAIDSLPPGVEPYAAVLSLSPEYVSDGGSVSWAPDTAVGGQSPHSVSPEEARTRPERVHDEAVLLADLLDRLNVEDISSLDTERLTDLYVLLSDVQRGADHLRRSVSEPLLARLGPNQELHGRFGTVRRTTRERRYPKDDETVLDALDEYGIPHEWVLGVDPDKLDVVLAVTELRESAVYDVEEQVYVQKTRVDEDEKLSRLRGLANRLEEIDGGEELQADIADLERRLDETLSAD